MDSPPFWSQRRHRNPPSPLISPVILILAVPILVLVILFFILPPFVSHATNLIRPNSVKKSWDYFNIVLVLFAVLCGVFARRNDEVDVASSDEGVVLRQNSVDSVSNFVSEPRHSVVNWLEYPDRKEYVNVTADIGGVRLRRSSSSYPDLRNESLWETGGGGNVNGLRFHDDFEVNIYQARENLFSNRPQVDSDEDAVNEEDVSVVSSPVREIPVDKFQVSSAQETTTPPPEEPPETTPQETTTPPPPETTPPPPPPVKKKRRSHRSVPRKVKKQAEREIHEETQVTENQPPPPPPQVEPEPETDPKPEPEPEQEQEPEFQFPDVISETVPKKKSGVNVKKEFATAIASLYKGQKKKKKKRVKTRDIYENATENTSSPPPAVEPQLTAPPPPPPPPPLPPAKKLQNLFRKGLKTKRVHSVNPTGAPPPPPPPPPPNSIFNNLFKSGGKSSRFSSSSSHAPPPAPPLPPSSILNSIFKTGSISRRFKHSPPPAPPPPPTDSRRTLGRPPKPPRPSNNYAESAIYAPPSPLIPMPPPPPPFKMAEVKFVARGDFVRIQSASSSMCSSPERDDFDTSSVKSDGQDMVGSSVTCPSPDVNTKADNFIARLRDEWRLEKMSSMKEKRTVG